MLFFGLIYSQMGFSSISKEQSILIIFAGISEIGISHHGAQIDRTGIQLALAFSLLALASVYLMRARIHVEDGFMNFRTLEREISWKCTETRIEVGIKSVGRVLGYGDLTFHRGGHKVRISGVGDPVGARRELIDTHQMIPHPQKASWLGTLPLFLAAILLLFLVESLIFWLLLDLFQNRIEKPMAIISAIILLLISNLTILNLKIPRHPEDPSSDIRDRGIIARGAWTEVFPDGNENVVKQLFRCGWGHNDYSMHRVPVLGSRICGERNPLALVIIHNVMLLYQMVGIHRRRIYQDFIESIPGTGIPSHGRYRYTQELAALPLSTVSGTDSIMHQFSSLNSQLRESGLNLDDIHAGNVRLAKNGRIKIVDGELYTDGEVLIKTILVRLFDGRRVSGMEPVLGFDRIVRWVDNRTSVDEILGDSRPPHRLEST